MNIRREAVIIMYPTQIERLLQLPEGLRVDHVRVLHDPYALAIVVRGDTLKEVQEDQQSPVLTGTHVDEVIYYGGKEYRHATWQLGDVNDF